MDKSKSDSKFHERLSSLLEGESDGDVALVLSERIINMPAAIAAPSYKMLLEEIQWANEDVCPIVTNFLMMGRKSPTNSATS
jgi:protein BCP1